MTACARPGPRTSPPNSSAANPVDELARAVASRSSRRTAFLALFGSLFVPGRPSSTAQAQGCVVCSALRCTGSGCSCDPTACASIGGCCDGDSCCDTEECCFAIGNLPACYHVHCQSGLAFCLTTDGDRCRSGCVDLRRDSRHCGRCGHRCGHSHRCRSGNCHRKRMSHSRNIGASAFVERVASPVRSRAISPAD